ncbi:hypothetical protein [Mesorhizobium sp.]|uniref:hypothetical protein n=1 Tax=Mesorhizobium sp. TaxID=1871066 RepID=UPI00121296D0|nr:hypothetical protein [Mesorhizobium sp.]TIM09152.1 MAG: hypothetical protein E5Y62_13420 [Mesorhizobium sp.]
MANLPDTISAKGLGKLLGITDRWVRDLEKQGVLKRKARGQYDPCECVQAFVGWKTRTEVAKQSDVRDTLREAREREIAQRIAIKDHRLIDLAEHDAICDEVFGALKSELLGLPARTTRDLDLRQKLEIEINGALNRTSDRIAKAAAELGATGQGSQPAAEDDA